MSMTEWVVELSELLPGGLAGVRHLPHLRYAPQPAEGRGWLRGWPADQLLPLPVRQLPAAATYRLGAEDQLFPAGRTTPVSRLPAGLSWLTLREQLPLTLPPAALPGRLPDPAPLRLVPLPAAAPGTALLTTLAAWLHYADTAPEVRLLPLRFAVAGPARVLVLGAPLPPLPGRELWQHGPLLLPSGLGFESELVATLVTRQLNLAGTELLLFGAEGGWERIPEANLVPATRAAVRLTTKSFSNG